MEDKSYQQNQKKEQESGGFFDEAINKAQITLRKYDNKVHLIYILYCVGLIFGITYLIGLVLAYIYRSDAVKEGVENYIISNFTWQIKTFWYSLILFGLALITVFTIVIPFIFIVLGYVWWIYRVIRGWQYLARKKEIPDKFFA